MGNAGAYQSGSSYVAFPKALETTADGSACVKQSSLLHEVIYTEPGITN